MSELFKTNVVVCPNCTQAFEHNKINGIALIQAASDIEARKRMYTKLMLDSIEALARRGVIEFPVVRKIVLDNVNDFSRDVQTILGLGEDVE